jgi:ABC-type sugar transport system substrate-binding protein
MNRFKAMIGVLAVFVILGGVQSLAANEEPQPSNPIFAQRLVEKTIKAHRDMLDVIFHVTPPNSTDNMAIAAYTAKERGAKSGDDDLGVITTGKPVVEVQKDGVRIGVLLPLKDRSGSIIGALGLMYTYHAGQKEKDFLHRSEKIRNNLAKQIASREALFEKE